MLLFLLIGMLAGSEGIGGVYFDDPWLTQLVGVAALVFILFDGGLATRWEYVRPVVWEGLALSTLGVLITAVLVGAFAVNVLGFSPLIGMLLGAIVSSTDAAAVFSVLRYRSVRLKGQLEPLLELESGSNDPMAVFLTAGLTQLIANPQRSLVELVPMFLQQMLLGALLGFVFGRGMVFIVNRFQLGYEGLYPVLTLSMALLTYGVTASLGGNGFLAVYLAGLVIGNRDFIHHRSLSSFHDGLAWLMQITMFLTLGLLVFPSRLVPIVGLGLLVSLFLIFVARPVAVFLALLFSKLGFREKALVSWVGLRGATPIILATFPLLAGIPLSDTIFHLVFFIVLTSVLLQGTLITPVARWLRVDAPATAPPAYPLVFVPRSAGPDSDLVEVEIAPDSRAVGKPIVALGLPKGALIVLINKQDEFVVPSGSTVLEAGDRMQVLGDHESIERTRSILNATRSEAPTT